LCLLFFFFSSRRRHTRFSRDWSSDVCSSDLGAVPNGSASGPVWSTINRSRNPAAVSREITNASKNVAPPVPVGSLWVNSPEKSRSEERRVGKECRSRWEAENEKKEKTKTEQT